MVSKFNYTNKRINNYDTKINLKKHNLNLTSSTTSFYLSSKDDNSSVWIFDLEGMIDMDPQNTSKDSTISVKNFITDILMAFDYIFTMTFIRIFNFNRWLPNIRADLD